MKKHMRRVAVLVLGWALIAFGIVGLFLPFLQGVLFILLGLYVLSRESETARGWLHRVRDSHPGLDEKLKQWGKKWRKRGNRSNVER
jgi:uncharacterized membrane protein YbaN (DUF454 family)